MFGDRTRFVAYKISKEYKRGGGGGRVGNTSLVHADSRNSGARIFDHTAHSATVSCLATSNGSTPSNATGSREVHDGAEVIPVGELTQRGAGAGRRGEEGLAPPGVKE